MNLDIWFNNTKYEKCASRFRRRHIIVKSGSQKWNFGESAKQFCKSSNVKMLLEGKM